MRGDEGETDVKGRGYTGAAHKQPPTTHPQGGAPAEQPPTPATAAGVAHPHLALGPLPPELPPLLMQCTPGHLPGCPSPPPPAHPPGASAPPPHATGGQPEEGAEGKVRSGGVSLLILPKTTQTT